VTDLVMHDSVAVTNHALGLLSESEARAVEAHLAGCTQCTTECAAVRDTVVALDELPPEFFDQTPADPSDLVFQRTLRAIRAEKRSRARHRLARPLTAAAVALLVALGGAFVAGRSTAPQSPTTQSPITQAAGGHTVQGAGLNGAALRVSITPSPSGDWVRLVATATGFPRGAHCRLIVITADGRREVAGSWTVPAAGGPDGGVVLAGSAAVDFSQVRAVAVDTDAGQELMYLQV
jgi:putative zinc finger protein